jgi:hypothetical protein
MAGRDSRAESGRKLGNELHKLRMEDRALYCMCYLEAQRRAPIRYDSNRTPENIRKFREETLKVYVDYKRGRVVLFDGLHLGDGRKLVRR